MFGVCVFEGIGEGFLDDTQHATHIFRVEVGERRYIAYRPHQRYARRLQARLKAVAEVTEHHQQIAFDRLQRIDRQLQFIDAIGQRFL